MSSTQKSPSVQEFLQSTIDEAKLLKNVSVAVLRNARAESKGYKSVKKYLAFLEEQDRKKASLVSSIYHQYEDKPSYLGTFYIPLWLYEYFNSDEDNDFISESGEDVHYEVESWLQSISSNPWSIKFSLIEIYPEHHHFETNDIPFMYDGKSTMVKVIGTGSFANDGYIQREYALEPERFNQRYMKFRTYFIEGGEPTPFLMSLYPNNWDKIRTKFLEHMPENLDFPLFWNLLKTDQHLQVAFCITEL